MKKVNSEDFINHCKYKHNNFYDYSQVEYINMQTHVKIICPIHGLFIQKPYAHKNGAKCFKCFHSVCDLNTFVNKAKNIHRRQV